MTTIGILTAGGDCPGLNAAIRAVTRSATSRPGWRVVGVEDGFRGLAERRARELGPADVGGIQSAGGTILGTSRDKPHRMVIGGRQRDVTDVCVRNASRLGIDLLVAIGGGGTQKNARRLARAGLPVVTLPKTIDNDIRGTDVSFGFDTALGVAGDALDRLHDTATSHHRIIVCEVMGHRAGWLALGAGLASGADVILLPELPFDLAVVVESIRGRYRAGRAFSLVCLAEGAHMAEEAAGASDHESNLPPPADEAEVEELLALSRVDARGPVHELEHSDEVLRYHEVTESRASRLARVLQHLTGLEARVTTLGHVLRGGSPTAADRLLATRLGVAAVEAIADGLRDVLMAVRGDRILPVPLDEAIGTRLVPAGHPWLAAARSLGTCLGSERG